jgi:hypothetical protein
VIEKTQRRAVTETHHERVGLKHENNPLHEVFGGDEQYLHFDDADAHEALIESGLPQTWYFAIADCDGRLEVFRDEEGGRDHLLGLDMLWVDIDDSDFDGFESDRKGLTKQQREGMRNFGIGVNDNEDADSFIASHEAIENIRHDRADRYDQINRQRKK